MSSTPATRTKMVYLYTESVSIVILNPFCLLINQCGWSIKQVKWSLLCWRRHISCICEVLLSIWGAGHIRHLCKMQFGSSVIPYNFEPIRCENSLIGTEQYAMSLMYHTHWLMIASVNQVNNGNPPKKISSSSNLLEIQQLSRKPLSLAHGQKYGTHHEFACHPSLLYISLLMTVTDTWSLGRDNYDELLSELFWNEAVITLAEQIINWEKGKKTKLQSSLLSIEDICIYPI